MRFSEWDVVVRRRWAVIKIVTTYGAGGSPASSTRKLGLHRCKQDALLVMPARLRGIIERTTATADVELEVLDRRPSNRRALAASVGRKDQAVAVRSRRRRPCWRRIGHCADRELAQAQAK